MSALLGHPVPRQRRTEGNVTRERAVLASAIAFALGFAFLLVHRSPAAAVALALLPPAAYVFTKSYGGLVVGLGLILMLPYWVTLGSAQLSVLRLASAAAATSFLFTRRFRPNITDYALVFFVVIIVLGWLLQYDQPQVGRVVLLSLTPVGFYLGARVIPASHVRLVLGVILFAGTIGALTVLYEFGHGQTLFSDPATYLWNSSDSEIFRPGGIFGSPPAAATILSFVILLGLAYLTTVRGWLRLVTLGSLGVCVLGLVATFTRGGIIGAAVGCLVFLWLMKSPLLRPLRVAWFIAALMGLLFLLLPTLQQSPTFQEALVRPGNLAVRETYWRTALPITTSSTHNLIFGIGTGTLETPSVSSNVRVSSALASVPQLIRISLHNQYVSTLFEQGILGLAALLVYLLSALARAVRAALASREPTHAALAASIVTVMVIMTVDSVLLNGPSLAMIMVSTGLVGSLASTDAARAH